MKEIKPGFYKDLSIDDYHSSNGISKSGIMKISKSPIHYWHEYLNENKPEKTRSNDFIIGDMVHTKLMEPEKFEDRFCIAPICDRRTKKGKDEWENLLSSKGNKEICTFDMSYQANCMEESAKNNNEFISLIDGGMYESSIYWNDIETGVLCKSRPDILGFDYVADIKTTKDISPDSFARDCITYGYDIQAAMWQMAIHANFGNMVKSFFILAIEKDPPYATAVYLLSDDMIHHGRKRFQENLKIYKECLDKNEWHSIKPQILELPRWLKL